MGTISKNDKQARLAISRSDKQERYVGTISRNDKEERKVGTRSRCLHNRICSDIAA